MPARLFRHAARQLAMPLDEARVHLDLACAASNAAEAERHREDARILLERIGCPDFADR